MNKLFALVDCNNFFASCEKIFRPDLKHAPVVVLSNNDGCVIARSEEAKKLGIKMCQPFFEIKDLADTMGISAFSGNFPLYADISRRVMDTLSELCDKVEVYSVDEAFLEFTGYPFRRDGFPNPAALGKHVCETVTQWTGLPVSVGLGPSKTLAKLAILIGKQQHEAAKRVFDASDPAVCGEMLRSFPVNEVWGIGRRSLPKLQRRGIYTAWDLSRMKPSSARKLGGIVMERIVLELNGIACRELPAPEKPQQQMMHSRIFGQSVTKYTDLRQAVCHFCAEVSSSLRAENLYAGDISLFITTGPFQGAANHYSNSASLPLPGRSRDSRRILRTTLQLLDQLWKPGYAYKRAGIILGDLSPNNIVQTCFFDYHPPETPATANDETSDKLMATLDALNEGRKRIWFASEGMLQNPVPPALSPGDSLPDEPGSKQTHHPPRWKVIRQKLSPSYTIRWADIPVVH